MKSLCQHRLMRYGMPVFMVVVVATILVGQPVASAQGTVHGHARIEKVKNNPGLGYVEMYEYKAFISPNGNGTGFSYHCGDPGTAWHPGTGCFIFNNVPAGTYSVMTVFPEFFPRGKVTSSVVVQTGQTTESHSVEPTDYAGYLSKSSWDPVGHRTIYQTFVATGSSIVRASFAKADDLSGGQIEFSIHQSNGGNVETWPQVGPTRSVNRGGYGGDHWVAWQAGEVPTVPGVTYAIRLNATSLQSIQPYWMNDSLYPNGTGYRGGQASPAGNDYYINVFSDSDGTIATMIVRSHGYGNLGSETSKDRWAQSYTARGSSLAGAALLATIGGSGGWNFPVRITIHQGTPSGPQIGPTKTMPCAYAPFFGVAGVSYSEGEVNTNVGQKYWIVYEKANGGGFNASRANEWDVYDGGNAAYWDGATWREQTYDLWMNIYEYASADQPTPGATSTPTPTPVAGQNLLENWSFEQSTGNTHPSWTNNIGFGTNGAFPNPSSAYDGTQWASFSYGAGGTVVHDLYQQVTVTPGQLHRLGAYFHVGGNNGTAVGSILWHPGAYPGLGNGTALASKIWANPAPIGDWSQISGNFTPNTSIITIIIRAEVSGWGGGVNVDAVSLVNQVSTEPTPTFTRTNTPTLTNTPSLTPTTTSTPFPDADGDGIPDSLEGGKNAGMTGKSNMYLPDSDGDGLGDGTEDANRNGVLDSGETNTLVRDSDGDGYEDGIEVLLLSSNPLNPGSPETSYVDSDGDGLPDSIDPAPQNPDADGDRFLDGYEAVTLGLPAVTNANAKPSLGDVDQNLFWDNADAQKILNFFASVPMVGMNPAYSDLDRNAVIDNADAQNSLNYFAYLLLYLPAN